MTNAKAKDVGKLDDMVAETTKTENPVSISMDELLYMYTILINASVPVRDIDFVNQLKQKLEVILKR